MGAYAGESPAKKIARVALYKAIDEDVRNKSGLAIVLAGPEALEVPLISKFLGYPPERILAIDIEPNCTAAARDALPGVRTFTGTAEQAILALGPSERISFAHLDFMGSLNDDAYSTLAAMRGRSPFMQAVLRAQGLAAQGQQLLPLPTTAAP